MTDRVTKKVLTELKNRLGPDSFKGVATTFLLKTVTFRLILEELERRRANDETIRDFVTRASAGYGIDHADINEVLAVLEPEVTNA